jgi:hypothetical protein
MYFSQRNTNATGKSWTAYYVVDTNLLRFTYSTDGTSATHLGVSWTPSINTWYHVAYVRSGSNFYFFVDGTQVGSTQSIGTANLYDSSAALTIGTLHQEGTGSQSWNELTGYLDEVRVSKGIARWTSNFVPPTQAYS